MTDSVSRRPLEQLVFDEWPAAPRALFDGTSLASKTGFTASFLTTDASNGHVRTSLLGAGELYAPDSRTLCVALWPQSRAAGVLARSGRAARINTLVRRNLSADMCVKMLLKPLDLPARIQPGVHYPLAKITQHVFFR